MVWGKIVKQPPGRAMSLDVDFVRSQFPAFSEPCLDGWAFFENAGGSYPCRQTVEVLSGFYRRLKVQPYYRFDASAAAGRAMDRSRQRWAEALGVQTDEVHFGPSTSQNTYVLAHAIRRMMRASKAELVVTQQDHEANSGVWRRLAEEGFLIREWKVRRSTGQLEIADLEPLLSEKTALLCMPACSNVMGQKNAVIEAGELAHAAGAWVIVDAVADAPHGLPDLSALPVDIWLTSLYKVYGVHQGLMIVRAALLQRLPNEGHFFNTAVPSKRLIPAGPDHAQVAAAGAVLDYIEALDDYHGGRDDGLKRRAKRVATLWRAHENAMVQPLLDFLAQSPHARLLGSPTTAGNRRTPTVSFLPTRHCPSALAGPLAERKISIGVGHFYAYRLLEALGINPATGLVRVSLVHYTNAREVSRLIDALEELL